jgi:hypothetical protein
MSRHSKNVPGISDIPSVFNRSSHLSGVRGSKIGIRFDDFVRAYFLFEPTLFSDKPANFSEIEGAHIDVN